MKKVFFNKIKKISAASFKKIKSEKLLKLITDGNIIIIRKAIDKYKILKICKKIDHSKLKKSRTTKMHQGVKNIYYEAEAPSNIKKNDKRYIVSNRSWYFFPWNKDKFNLVKLVQPIFNKVININLKATDGNNEDEVKVVVEHVTAMPGQGVTSMFNFGQSFGAIKGICAALKLPIYFVRPTKWKKHFNLIKTNKDASRTKVIEIYPNISSKLSRKKDSNKADAILIARYFSDTQL